MIGPGFLGAGGGSGSGIISGPASQARQIIYADLQDTSAMSFINGTRFPGTATGYLKANDISAYDASSTNTWSVIFWTNRLWRGISGGTGYSHALFTKAAVNASNGSTDHGIWIATAGTQGKEEELDVNIFTGTNKVYSNYRAKSQGNSSGASIWSCFALTYATGTVKNYFDAVLCSTISGTTVSQGAIDGTVTNAIPATMQRMTAPIVIGNVNNGTVASPVYVNSYNGIISHVIFYPNYVLTQSDITTLFKRGFPTNFSSLSGNISTKAVGAWDCGETSGNRLDSTSNANPLVPNGSVTQAKQAYEVREKSPLQSILRAVTYARCPVLDTSTMNGKNSLFFAGCHGLEARFEGLANWAGCSDFIAAVRPTILSQSDSVDRNICGTFSQDLLGLDADREYLFPYFYGVAGSGSQPNLYFRIRQGSAHDGQCRGQAAFAINNNYVVTVRQFGTGNAASYGIRINGTADTLDGSYGSWGSASNLWNTAPSGNVIRRMGFGIGYLNYLTAASTNTGTSQVPGDNGQDFFQGYIMHASWHVGPAASSGGALTTGEILTLENIWRTLCGT